MDRYDTDYDPRRPHDREDWLGDLVMYAIWVGFGLVALAAIPGMMLWLSGQLSGVLSGHGWPDSSAGDIWSILLGVVEKPGDPAAAWPSGGEDVGPAWLLYGILLLFVLALIWSLLASVRLAMNVRRRREFRRLRLGFASGHEIRKTLSARTVKRKAKSVRPSYAERRKFDPREVGFYLGRDIRSRQRLYASAEDVFIILAPPRQGKDVHFCAPYTIDAPGACIVTSTRADAFTNTYAMRAKVGKVHVFDPQGLTNWPEKLRWSPITGCEDPMVASSRAAAFVAGMGFEASGDAAAQVISASTLLRCYLHAAAHGERTMVDVKRWANQPGNLEPLALLKTAEAEGRAAIGWTGDLESLMATDARYRAIIWANVARTLSCFSDPSVLDACSPGPDEQFDLREFLAGRNTLYILGKEQKNASIAPVVTTMMEDMFDNARKIAGSMPSSRLDPPLTVELNEAAHIAPLPNLPGYMGDSGGFSISLHVYLQSLSQARARWGSDEAMIMWDNAAVRVIMGGAGNVDDLEDISRLMGEIEEKRRTFARNSDGTRREGVHIRDQRVLEPEEIRTLEFGRAVVVARSSRPVEVQLTPWWQRKDGKQIAAGKKRTEKLVFEYGERRRTATPSGGGGAQGRDALDAPGAH
ncbi:hypothetical protein GCM10010191_11210 [Actinomadura vinacea]|uniref:TraD/TraG TraM recognition site domain-containing protein n=1 Tax=Actinomadura vinacea TaxID=115336 RepID=A0ABP5VLX8_9ACTN